jgi:hypothetical protein
MKSLPDNPAFCHIQVPSGASSARDVAKTGLCVSTEWVLLVLESRVGIWYKARGLSG